MLVNDYRVFVQSTQPRKTQSVTQKTQQKEFPQINSVEEKTTPLQITSQFPVDYVNTKNYYANKYKLQQQKPKQDQSTQPQQKDTVSYFQQLTKITAIPSTYSVAFTTFYDLTKPKPALTQHSTSQATPKVYKEAKEQQTKQEVVTTYIANDLYYQRTSA